MSRILRLTIILVVGLAGPALAERIIDFDTEDDFATPLVNGQDLSSPPEFGLVFDISAEGDNLGAAIFDSDPAGPNSLPPVEDPDLLIDSGNVLILQSTDNATQTTPGIFDTPDDTASGGTIHFEIVEEGGVEALSIDVIDIDRATTVVIVLTDGTGATRTITIPGMFTGDIENGGVALATVSFTEPSSAIPGGPETTLESDEGFDVAHVVHIAITTTQSGAFDNLVLGCRLDAPCNDGNPATFDDRCRAGGICAGDGDCNNNQIPDLVEIAKGLEDDCNHNDIPDSCDLIDCLDDPDCDDCNDNGIPDVCDLVSGVLTDNNGDGIADECTQFDGGCDDNPDWSCVDNWNLNGVFPDNTMQTTFDVILDANDFVFLDVTVVIDSLKVIDNAFLNITQTGVGDMAIEGPGGLLLESVIQVGNDRGLKVTGNGPIVIRSGGTYRKSPDSAAPTTAELGGQDMLVGPGGRIEMTDDMVIKLGGSLVLQGPPPPDCPSCGGETPPIVENPNGGGLSVGDDVIFDGQVIFDIDSFAPFEIGGDLVNQSGGVAAAQGVDFSHATLVLNGENLQVFEVGGADLGAVLDGFNFQETTNYSIDTLEILGSADGPPVDVRFENSFENLAGDGPCVEALYVRTLALRTGATIELADVNLYYETLIDEGGAIVANGCGSAQELPGCVTDADCDDGSDCYADRCNDGTCVFVPETSLCADQDGDGLRDDNCVFQQCLGDICTATPIVFADMGGQFGSCLPDGTADGNDRFQAINCFSNKGAGGGGINTCEPDAPAAFNIDAGGQFGSCQPDGVCDGNDAFAALNAFSGESTCSCPLDGPAPVVPSVPAAPATADLALSSKLNHIRRGGLIEVDVLLTAPLEDLRGYQLHAEAFGGHRGTLDLVDVAIAGPNVLAPAAKAPAPYWSAFNVHTGQMVAGLDTAGQAVKPGYLATFTFRASADAAGRFGIALLGDPRDATQRSYLFPTPATGIIEIAPVKPLRVDVRP